MWCPVPSSLNHMQTYNEVNVQRRYLSELRSPGILPGVITARRRGTSLKSRLFIRRHIWNCKHTLQFLSSAHHASQPQTEPWWSHWIFWAIGSCHPLAVSYFTRPCRLGPSYVNVNPWKHVHLCCHPLIRNGLDLLNHASTGTSHNYTQDTSTPQSTTQSTYIPVLLHTKVFRLVVNTTLILCILHFTACRGIFITLLNINLHTNLHFTRRFEISFSFHCYILYKFFFYTRITFLKNVALIEHKTPI
jgi:hypothetical protein